MRGPDTGNKKENQEVFNKPVNPNYCAVVVELKSFTELANCDNVKAALIYGNSVIVSKGAKAGDIGLFFPVETQLSKEFLHHNNLNRKAELNGDQTKKGYFDEHGRIKAVKFRGHKSEGFFIPLDSIMFTGITGADFASIKPGMEFDNVAGFTICRKYVPQFNRRTSGSSRQQARKVSLEDSIVDGQFAFHYDTAKLDRNLDKFQPHTIISITEKLHGTSAVFGNLLTKRELSWWEKILKKLGVKIQETKYDYVWSSRRVIKGVGEPKENAAHYYDSDVWTDTFNKIKHLIPEGYTIYGEIVGYTKEGSAIQKGYHYGCPEKQHKLYVYRITVTNDRGIVVELSWPQVAEFCERTGLSTVPILYYGFAWDLLEPLDGHIPEGSLQDWFLATVKETYVDNRMCKYHGGNVPAEGVVVRIDGLRQSEAYKCKNFAFLEMESKLLDSGVADIETEESDAIPEN